jgi:hypothetical protein
MSPPREEHADAPVGSPPAASGEGAEGRAREEGGVGVDAQAHAGADVGAGAGDSGSKSSADGRPQSIKYIRSRGKEKKLARLLEEAAGIPQLPPCRQSSEAALDDRRVASDSLAYFEKRRPKKREFLDPTPQGMDRSLESSAKKRREKGPFTIPAETRRPKHSRRKKVTADDDDEDDDGGGEEEDSDEDFDVLDNAVPIESRKEAFIEMEEVDLSLPPPQPGKTQNCLALCMVFADDDKLVYTGGARQATRDHLRLATLEGMGYKVHSVDTWHKEEMSLRGRHLQSSFCVPHRFLQSLHKKWPPLGDGGSTSFGLVVFDYFWIPTHWNKCWGTRIMDAIVPHLAGMYDCTDFWFPNDKGGVMWTMVTKAKTELKRCKLKYRPISRKQMAACPLYSATEQCRDGLLQLATPMTNDDQMPIYLTDSHPFIRVWRD